MSVHPAMTQRCACAGSSSASRSSSMAASLDGEDGSPGKPAVGLDAAELGAPDCLLLGTNWSIPAHRWVTLICTVYHNILQDCNGHDAACTCNGEGGFQQTE